MPHDLTFFTNEPSETLLDRFKIVLKDVQYFDVLVGYFRTSGFKMLYDSFAEIEKIRILVGLSIDRKAFDIIDTATRYMGISARQTEQQIADDLVLELEHAPDTLETEQSIRGFMTLLKNGRLEIRAHPSQNIHSKVYISRFGPDDRDFGRVITGSSNFSYPGFVGQYEFNVELKNPADVHYALAKFETLWAEGIDVSETYVATVNTRTWLNDQITPYQLYLKLLYEYFKEDINLDESFESYLPDGFMELDYQKQAVVAAKKILESYNGVFLSDVVGLGKTYISALLAQQLPGKKLVICPPVLADYWRETFRDFHVLDARIESMGKLDHLLAGNYTKYDYIFIDEAHRFRNEMTQNYEKLYTICWGKKIILVSATPLNNTIDDIEAQLRLFQMPRHSTIPGVPNLEAFFSRLNRGLKRYDKHSPAYRAEVKKVAQAVRNQVLKYVMVRRTRREIVSFFSDDVSQQALFFPKLAEPQRIVYTFDEWTDQVFEETIEKLKNFRYARYMPLLYLTRQLSVFDQQSQRNVGGFMKMILVKRLESSFYAFKQTLKRFIASYESFLAMFDAGTIFMSKKIDVADLFGRDATDELLRLVDEDHVTRYAAQEFKPELRAALVADLEVLYDIQELWLDVDHDPKLECFVEELHSHDLLKDQQVIVFTESSETAEYVYARLEAEFPHAVLAFSSQTALYKDATLSTVQARSLISANFDPRYENPQSDIRILMTTDVLAEGVNLHRAAIVINYDLPWNPTRVLQRVGRVNRVGTAHQDVYIFNFFPTTQSSEHLGLEANIKAKIQAFHDMLGEDARYLTDDEDYMQHELFGEQVYQRLNDLSLYEGEPEERSELAYLQQIRKVRDEQPELFAKIKRLPRKARAGRQLTASQVAQFPDIHSEAVVTFFRQGMLKKFFLATPEASQEVTFLDVIDLLEVEDLGPEANKRLQVALPERFYELLQSNKVVFSGTLAQVDQDLKRSRGGQNEKIIITLVQKIRSDDRLTADDEQYFRQVLAVLRYGVLPAQTVKRLRTAVEQLGSLDALQVLVLFRSHVPLSLLETDRATEVQRSVPQEVILSAWLEV